MPSLFIVFILYPCIDFAHYTYSECGDGCVFVLEILYMRLLPTKDCTKKIAIAPK
jgi:hypothetical protein